MELSAYEVVEVAIESGFVVNLAFSDGSRITRNLEPLLQGSVFSSIRTDDALFRQVGIEDGALCWPNGADLDPLVLYFGSPEAAREQVLAAARGVIAEDPPDLDS